MKPTITPPETVEQLAERVDALEQRVTLLEQQAHAEQAPVPCASDRALSAPEPEPGMASAIADVPARAVPQEAGALNAGVLSTAGIALLGIAGAYLLRAVSGSALLPRVAGASVAALYAAGWAYLASRNRLRNRTGAVLYALASVLMLGPMLWEMSIRLQAMAGELAALLLAGYAAAAAVWARKDQQAMWFSMAWAGAAAIALAEAIGARAMLPFAGILLAMAAWGEWSRLRRRAVASAPVVALAADACALALLLIYRLPADARPEYPSIPAAVVLAVPLLLLGVNAAGVGVRTCGRGERISIFDLLQVSLALLLAGCGWIWMLPGSGRAACAALCAAIAAGCYAAAFARREIDARNFIVFATWAPALLICAVFLLLDAAQGAAAFAVLAVGFAGAARGLGSAALAWHGALYAALAEAVSGLLTYTMHAVWGPAVGGLTPLLLLVVVAAVAVYALARESAGEAEALQAVHLMMAVLGAWPVDALLTHGLVRAAAHFLTPTAFHIALVRTIALCGLAVALALAGSRLGRVALVRAAYTLTGFAAAKLFFEDLRHGRLDFAAGSIFLVALALIAIPRVTLKKRAA